MYDYETVNKSFIKVSEKLKAKDIRNYRWMLYLENETLQGVDPYDPDLPEVVKHQIIVECLRNPIYFYREVLKVVFADGAFGQFNLNLNSAARIYCTFLHLPTLEFDCRQSSKLSTGLCTLIYKFLFDKDKESQIQSRTIEQSRGSMYKITQMINHLPDYVRYYIGYNRASKTILHNTITRNRILIASSPKNSAESYKIAGSKVYGNYLLIDELLYSDLFKYYHAEARPRLIRSEYYITTTYNMDNMYQKELWKHTLHWDDFMYDSSIDELQDLLHYEKYNLITIHYEPEKLLDVGSIKSLLYAVNAMEDNEQNRKIVREELCIRPFDDEYQFTITDYLKGLQ